MAKPPAARADAQSDAFIREVDEAYRQDRLESFWTRWGRLILVVVGLGLVALAAFLWWREQETARVGGEAEAYAAALSGLELGEPEARAEIDRFAADGSGYAAPARLVRARLLAEDGDNAGALEEYRAVAADTRVAEPLRALARIRAARLAFDEAEPQAILNELGPLAEPGSAWFGVAGEMAAIAHLRLGDEAAAGELLTAIAGDQSLPPTLRGRASQLAASLVGAAATPPADAEPAQGAGGDEAPPPVETASPTEAAQ